MFFYKKISGVAKNNIASILLKIRFPEKSKLSYNKEYGLFGLGQEALTEGRSSRGTYVEGRIKILARTFSPSGIEPSSRAVGRREGAIQEKGCNLSSVLQSSTEIKTLH